MLSILLILLQCNNYWNDNKVSTKSFNKIQNMQSYQKLIWLFDKDLFPIFLQEKKKKKKQARKHNKTKVFIPNYCVLCCT